MKTVNVLLYRYKEKYEETNLSWIADGLEIDNSSYGNTKEQAKKNWISEFKNTLALAKERGDPIFLQKSSLDKSVTEELSKLFLDENAKYETGSVKDGPVKNIRVHFYTSKKLVR